MPSAIVYLKKSLCGKRQERLEAECKRFAAAHGFAVSRTIIETRDDVLAWTLLKAAALGINGIVTPTVEHIDYRTEPVLQRCALMIVHPYGWYHKGSIDTWIPHVPEGMQCNHNHPPIS
ncbi:hypothetical protein [Nocardia donostiensis]|uniref:Resolvase/invertase-type recombinase catalytic domain-containing protein n=1 Tax=Nocardia donostiensis TaxID=1538463 RepID=A0A1W0B6Y2_9NOCA|nr:hypothetical protein [Nocardia donostiensis]ONM46204.1 hypothetical protein B0T46_24355 [Nocardia donostiensis]OQS14924.1 hypothetical protein B0T36_12920 [Nocardia donostiensis]OQS18254.1 hypothetical protein B0T44_20670 [Nocardia donostiensis]